MSRASERHRSFLLTNFQYPDDHEYKFPSSVKYCIWQLEKCPSTDRLHHQIFVQYWDAQTFSQVKKVFGKSVKIIPHIQGNTVNGKKSSELAMERYCSKSDTRVEGPWQFGKPPAQGTRSDIQQAIEVIKSTPCLSSVVAACPAQFIRMANGMLRMHGMLHPPSKRMGLGYYIWGPTGIGKSHNIYELFPRAYRYVDHMNTWFCGYDGEEVVVMDEYSGLTPMRFLLQLCDKYPMRAPVKGGHVSLRNNLTIIISNYPPPQVPEFLRRFNVIHVTDRYQCENLEHMIDYVSQSAESEPGGDPRGSGGKGSR